MPTVLHFEGFIRNVSYHACVTAKDVAGKPLPVFDLNSFEVNTAPTSGLIKSRRDESTVAYSRWVSPKRTRSYPFERIYNTYNSPKILTIIPVIKDEGADGDLDKIGWMTFSWMNLLNIYIVLAYYDSAEKNRSVKQRDKEKLTRQKFDSTFVRSQITEIVEYKQSALHWNKNLFDSRFASTFSTALDAYTEISKKTGVRVHRQDELKTYLNEIRRDFAYFMKTSHNGSERASSRESVTLHRLEHLADGDKALFHIENYLGGIYYLTVDEAFLEGSTYVIQESKNTTTGVLPSLGDIRDGLFKLILFANMDQLKLGNETVKFRPRLKLTSPNITGRIQLPSSDKLLGSFVKKNERKLATRHKKIIEALSREVGENPGITIEIAGSKPHGTD